MQDVIQVHVQDVAAASLRILHISCLLRALLDYLRESERRAGTGAVAAMGLQAAPPRNELKPIDAQGSWACCEVVSMAFGGPDSLFDGLQHGSERQSAQSVASPASQISKKPCHAHRASLVS
jgi:hypothetical protein